MVRRPLPLLLCVLLATACGTASDPDPGDGGEPERPVSNAVAAAREREAGDVNGDGYPDLVFAADLVPDELSSERDRVIVVYGSEQGLDPDTRTVLDPGLVVSVAAPVGGGDHHWGGTADLDGDGFADIPLGHRAGAESERPVNAVLWGGPDGPEADPVPLVLPEEGDWEASLTPPAIGDFDGDGAPDLALVSSSYSGDAVGEGYAITVLYGPFDRDGAPARTGSHVFPRWIMALVAEPPNPSGAPSRLLVQHSSDGEQTLNTLLVTDAADPADWAEVDTVGGSMAAFGDVDGDGFADLVVGDDGNRNNEPGFETEPPEVHHRLNVYPGPLTADPGDPVGVDLPGDGTAVTGGTRLLSLCDTDGDGAHGAAVGLAMHGVDTVHWADGALEFADGGPLVRRGPEDGPLGGGSADERVAVLSGCADHDADGSDELLLTYSLGYSPGYEVPVPARWWVTDGREDLVSFDSADLGD